MLPGDVVQFNVATDRRNGDRRATNVLLHRLIEDQRNKSGREQVGGAMTGLQLVVRAGRQASA